MGGEYPVGPARGPGDRHLPVPQRGRRRALAEQCKEPRPGRYTLALRLHRYHVLGRARRARRMAQGIRPDQPQIEGRQQRRHDEPGQHEQYEHRTSDAEHQDAEAETCSAPAAWVVKGRSRRLGVHVLNLRVRLLGNERGGVLRVGTPSRAHGHKPE